MTLKPTAYCAIKYLNSMGVNAGELHMQSKKHRSYANASQFSIAEFCWPVYTDKPALPSANALREHSQPSPSAAAATSDICSICDGTPRLRVGEFISRTDPMELMMCYILSSFLDSEYFKHKFPWGRDKTLFIIYYLSVFSHSEKWRQSPWMDQVDGLEVSRPFSATGKRFWWNLRAGFLLRNNRHFFKNANSMYN